MFLKSITLTNFGPYKGEQRIEFPDDPGVEIVYGENMRGKSTLLNAIRYALFGKVLTRGDQSIALHQIGNWETRDQGTYGFKVVLAFEHEGSQYELTRECKVRPGVAQPKSDFDYQQDQFLRKDGSVLAADRLRAELSRIMPETVSRFFLFDGELLQQYEELLRNESEMGRKIKESIERILGLPTLTNARAHLTDALREAQARESKAAQRNQKTRMLGGQHESALKLRDYHQAELERLTGQLEDAKAEKTAKEEQLRKTERTKALLDEHSHLVDDIAADDARIKEKQGKLEIALADAWRALLAHRVKSARDAIQNDLNELRDKHRSAVISLGSAERIRQAIDSGECSTCGQDLTSAARERLMTAVKSTSSDEERLRLESEIQNAQSRLTALLQIDVANNVDFIESLKSDIDAIRVHRADLQDRLADIREKTKNLDEAEVRRLYAEYDKAVTDITILQDGIKNQEAKIKEVIESIARIEREMAKFTDADLDEARARKDLCEKLKALFAAGVDAYRDRLRDKVEEDASDLFRKLTSEPDYAGLQINENYGLTIVHADGTLVPIRSAGAEHVVALSLMGALQRNAPLRGPIVMDSPFGRLDDAHTEKVVSALPSIADQILLLVYESELKPDQAREELKGALRKEYKIVRRSARHSEIETII